MTQAWDEGVWVARFPNLKWPNIGLSYSGLLDSAPIHPPRPTGQQEFYARQSPEPNMCALWNPPDQFAANWMPNGIWQKQFAANCVQI